MANVDNIFPATTPPAFSVAAEPVADFSDDTIRMMAQAARDAARDMVESAGEDPVNAGIALGLLREAQAACDAIPARGAVPRGVANRVKSTAQAVSLAVTESTTKITRSHSNEKAMISESTRERRESETAIQQIIRAPERMVRAVTGQGEREEEQAARSHRTTGLAAAGVGMLSSARRGTVGAVRRVLGADAANRLDAGIEEVSERTVESAQAMGSGVSAMGAGDIRGAVSAADAAAAIAERNLRDVGVAAPVAGAVGGTQRTVTSNVGAAVAMARGAFSSDEQQREFAREQARKALDRNTNVADAAADARAMLTSTGRAVNGVWREIQNDPNLRRIFDTDGDNLAELNEIVAVLKNRYHVDSRQELDRNRDGKVTIEDIRAIVAQAPAPAPAARPAAAQANGGITFNNILAATQGTLNADARFDAMFDKNHDGTISIAEIRQVLNDRYGINSLETIGHRDNSDGRNIVDRADLMRAIAAGPKR